MPKVNYIQLQPTTVDVCKGTAQTVNAPTHSFSKVKKLHNHWHARQRLIRPPLHQHDALQRVDRLLPCCGLNCHRNVSSGQGSATMMLVQPSMSNPPWAVLRGWPTPTHRNPTQTNPYKTESQLTQSIWLNVCMILYDYVYVSTTYVCVYYCIYGQQLVTN